jgi:hypothetical protein
MLSYFNNKALQLLLRILRQHILICSTLKYVVAVTFGTSLGLSLSLSLSLSVVAVPRLSRSLFQYSLSLPVSLSLCRRGTSTLSDTPLEHLFQSVFSKSECDLKRDRSIV